jgi:predicted Zn-dependent protease
VGRKGTRVYQGFPESPDILNSIVTFSALGQNSYLINTEGTQLQHGQIRYRLELFIQGKATDGMNIERYYNFDWVDPKDAPSDKDVSVASATLRKEMEGLVKASLNEPSVGPALLTGRAGAVFFHEVFGHRAEGHRQKDISKGRRLRKRWASRSCRIF